MKKCPLCGNEYQGGTTCPSCGILLIDLDTNQAVGTEHKKKVRKPTDSNKENFEDVQSEAEKAIGQKEDFNEQNGEVSALHKNKRIFRIRKQRRCQAVKYRIWSGTMGFRNLNKRRGDQVETKLVVNECQKKDERTIVFRLQLLHR